MKVLKIVNSTCLSVLATFWILITTHNPCPAQYITTVAGNGTVGFTGDGGPATAAEISYPLGIALDNSGNLFLTDHDNHRIRRVNATGIITTIAGTGTPGYTGIGGPATDAELLSPIKIAVDNHGNIFIADAGAFCVCKINASGILFTYAGNGTTGYSGDGGPATDAAIGSPADIAIDTLGNLFIAGNNVIRKVNTTGIISTVAGTGVVGFGGDGGPATNAVFNNTYSVAIDSRDQLYIVDENNNRVRKVDTAGVITTFAGNGVSAFSGDGGPATDAEFIILRGVFVDDFNNVLIADQNSGRVRSVNTSGIIETIAGGGSGPLGDGGPATAATFDRPWKVARCGKSNIYIADSYNQRIRMLITRPFYVNGPVQHITMCHGTLGLDTLLAANDSNSGNTETWALVSGPHHGTAAVHFTATSTGSTIYPSGLSYTSTPGYYGGDTLVVWVTDGVISDTTTLYLTIQGPANAGVISGPDTVCRPNTVSLTDSVAGGVWSASNGKATVAGGMVTGISSGPDTISYTVTNSCGPVAATFVIAVKGCQVSVDDPVALSVPLIYPNPGRQRYTLNIPGQPNDPVTITLTTLDGRRVQSWAGLLSEASPIGLNAPPGLYFVTITTPGNRWVEKVVVK